MALTVGELNAVLTVNDTNFGKTLDEAKNKMEKVAHEGLEMGDDINKGMDKGVKGSEKLNKNIDKSSRRLRRGQKSAKSFGEKIGKAFKIAAVTAFARQIGVVAKQMADLALEAQESAAAFEITFAGSVDEVTRFVNKMSHAFGMTRAEMQQVMAVTGSVIQGLGLNSQAAAEMSTKILNLSGDLAAFMNIQEGASMPANAMRKALTGEFESLKSLGIVLRSAEIETRALAMTNKKSVKDLTQAEKATVSLMLIEEKMGHIKGQLGREAEGAANQIRQLRAEFKEMQTSVGFMLLPMVEELIPAIREMMPAFEGVASMIANLVKAVLTGFMPAFHAIADIIALISPNIEILAHFAGVVLKKAFQFIADLLNATLIPALEAVNKLYTFIANTLGYTTEAQKAYNREAETAEGVIQRLNDAIEAGVDPQVAFNNAIKDATELGIEQSEVYDDATQIAFGFSEAKQQEIRSLISAKKAHLENLRATANSSYQSFIYEKQIKATEEELEELERQLLQNIYAHAGYVRAQGMTTDGTEEFTEETEESTEAVKQNTVQLGKNTQAKLDNMNIQNESLTALTGFLNATMELNDLLKEEGVEQEKLNTLLAKRAEIQKLVNKHKGVGEVQTEVELAQIAKLRAQEAKLLEQKQKGIDLRLEIAGAELDLQDAIVAKDEKGEEADARDELRIKQQRLRLEQLKAEQDNSKDVTIELAQVQQNLSDAIKQSTMASQEFLQAEKALGLVNKDIAKQEIALADARITTDENQLELAQAKLAVENARALIMDKNMMHEARKSLMGIMGMSGKEIDDFLAGMGINVNRVIKPLADADFGENFDTKSFFKKETETDKPDTETTTTNGDNLFTKELNKTFSGGGGFGGASIGFGGSGFLGDHSFDLGNRNSVASRVLDNFNKGQSSTNVVVNIDPTLDAEAKVDKQLADFNDRLNVGRRFKVL